MEARGRCWTNVHGIGGALRHYAIRHIRPEDFAIREVTVHLFRNRAHECRRLA